MVKLLKNKAVSVSLSVLSSVALVSAVAYATSIGDAVSVSTTLGVTGATTLTSAALSTTLDVTGATTLTSATLSTTLSVTGVSTLSGGFISASSTVSSGVFNVGSGSLGVATSSPAYGEVGIVGDVFQTSVATTTHFLSSTGSSKGGCIEMLRSDGTTKVRLWIGASSTAQKTDTNFLFVEAGTCQ